MLMIECPDSRHLSRREALGAAASFGASAVLGSIPSRAAAGFDLAEIAPGVFVHKGRVALANAENGGDIANASFVVGRDAVAVIDTGGSRKIGEALRDAIRAVTDRPIRYVINTHMHPDHVFGNAAFEADKPLFLAHHKLARGLAARAEHYLAAGREAVGAAAFEGTRVPAPATPVETRLDIDLGGRSLVLEAQKTAHTDNDLVVRDAATGTLFLGDLLFADHIPVLDGSIRGWLALLDEIKATPGRRAVPGHGPASLPWPQALEPERRYLGAIAAGVRRIVKAGGSLVEAIETAGQAEKDAWLLFAAYHPRNVTAAFAELEWE